MVTDEERDYMYRVYASDATARLNLGIRRRLAPLLGNDRKKIELMNALLFSMPGTPVIYYGDEIGMGDNFYLGDRNGVRTPMQWNGDRNAGFSRANPQKLFLPVIIDPEYHYETVNVETQQNNPHSILWWMKRLIDLRREHQAFGRGSLEFLSSANHRVLAFCREWKDQHILVICNLSRFPQCAELELGRWEGLTPVELFGGSDFPPVGKRPYVITLGPHSFYWFALERRGPEAIRIDAGGRTIHVESDWHEVLAGDAKRRLESVLPEYLYNQRWFAGKARKVRAVALTESLPVLDRGAVLSTLDVRYTDGTADAYLVPLDFVAASAGAGPEGEKAASIRPDAIIAPLQRGADGTRGYLYDAATNPDLGSALFHTIVRRRRVRGSEMVAVGKVTKKFRDVAPNGFSEIRFDGLEHSNTSVRFGDQFILKLYRRLQRGVSPDLEVGRMLTENTSFGHTAPLAGWIEGVPAGREWVKPPSSDSSITLGILHRYVGNEGDCWQYTIDWLGRYYERVLLSASAAAPPAPPEGPSVGERELSVGTEVEESIGSYLEWARLLARRTAELHLHLASASEEPDFVPEPFSKLYQRSMYQSMRNLTGRVLRRLREQVPSLTPALRSDAERLLERESQLLKKFQDLLIQKIGGSRIRCHGDYHLGQVLFTGKDFVIIDFEGEPARPISERRIKRSPLRDVAGMLRSFHYAAYAALPSFARHGVGRPIDLPKLEPWARFWNHWAQAVFLQEYLDFTGITLLLPASRPEIELLLDVLTLEKAVYEVGYELDSRPEWLSIPLQAISESLDRSGVRESVEKRTEADPR
ncbi:MAG: putative maltokinase, partial [Vicinamibacteria bacterium]